MPEPKYNKEYFNELYETKVPFYRWYLNKKNVLLAKILKKFINKGKLLDIGCGDGNIMNYFAKDFDVYGIDMSKFIIESIKEKNSKAKVKVCDIEKENIPFDEKFDVIILWNIVEHLHNPKEVMEKIKKNLKDDGIIVAHLPTKNNIISRLEYWIIWEALFHDPTHIYEKPIKIVNQMFKEAGYKIIDAFSGQFIPFFLTRNSLILNSTCQYLVFLKKDKAL